MVPPAKEFVALGALRRYTCPLPFRLHNSGSLAAIRHLRNAPIVEAIFDVRVEARPDFVANEFSGLKAELQGAYPVMEERRGVSLELAFGAHQPKGMARARNLGVNAYFFRSTDKVEVAQFRVDGFTFNRLRPYTDWDDLLPRTLQLFQSYLRVARPKAITRIATRFINRLTLPSRRLELFLSRVPVGVPGTEGALRAFFDTAIAAEPNGGMVKFSQRVDPASNADTAILFIDIDTYFGGRQPPQVDVVESRMRELRDLKNRVFFGSITEELARLFE